MASVMLSTIASTLLLRTAFSGARAAGLSPQFIVSPTSSVTTTSMPSLVVRAERYEGEPKRHISQTPLEIEPDTHRKKFFLEPGPPHNDSATWLMEEKKDCTEIWFKMPGVTVMDINMYVKDNKLYIQEKNNIKPFQKMMIQPFENVQLPPDSRKEDIVAKLGNGILYVYVPKTTKPEVPYDIPVEDASW